MLRSLIGSGADGAGDVIDALAGHGLDPTETTAVRLFGEWSPAGSAHSFTAERPVVVVIAAPEGASVLEGGVPASDLDVEVRRTRPRAHGELELPPPLAEPRLDFRVDRATALSYEVKAGEYIQIIDVEGKQCSDFLAFHRRKLEEGIERGFDPTITRTLMGNAFPQPGLYSKFYDLDMDVLVEVIRDTVGRHDSFLLACTSRYYENLGYFGHTNCTDNFNRQLETYAIAPRKGWQALNFFYNTMFATRSTSSSSTSRGPGRATMSCCAPPRIWSAPRAHAPTMWTRRTDGTRPRCMCVSTPPSTRSRRRSRTA